jgi:four helix bundle protein
MFFGRNDCVIDGIFQHQLVSVANHFLKLFARFVEIATGSLFEIVSQARISLNQKFLAQNSYDQMCHAAEKQSRMLSGLRRSLVEE